MTEIKRRNFPASTVRKILDKQGYCCATCGGFLQQGYHQHHINADATDIREENLALDCPFCHRGKMGETKHLQALDASRQEFNGYLRTALTKYEQVIRSGLGLAVDEKTGKPIKQLSGSHIGELNSSIDNYIKTAWRLHNPVHYPQPLPPEIQAKYDAGLIIRDLNNFAKGFKRGLTGQVPKEDEP